MGKIIIWAVAIVVQLESAQNVANSIHKILSLAIWKRVYKYLVTITLLQS